MLHVINNEAISRPAVGSDGLDIPSCYTDSAVDINNTPFRLIAIQLTRYQQLSHFRIFFLINKAT